MAEATQRSMRRMEGGETVLGSGRRTEAGDARGVVPVVVRGGPSHVTVRRPGEAGVRLHVGRGAADAADRYEVDIFGGASHLRIATTKSTTTPRKEEP